MCFMDFVELSEQLSHLWLLFKLESNLNGHELPMCTFPAMFKKDILQVSVTFISLMHKLSLYYSQHVLIKL